MPPFIIVISGPESVGKSALCKQLAEDFKANAISEYARDYVEQLNRPYAYFDLVNIAHKQKEEFEKAKSSKEKLIIFDTGPEITKVWFEELYQKVPKFLNDFLEKSEPDLYLLCQTDLEWKYDKTRENNGAKREYLYKRYKTIIKKQNFRYAEISGFGQKRFINAKKALASAYDLQNL
jgi:nicotinamide riboside kinase